jgi:leucine dehydrogenase
MYPYASEADAIRDVLRLSRGMTYKAALTNVKLGGGKSVIIGDPHTQKSERLLQAMGVAIDRLQARYIAGEDIGTNPDDMRVLRQKTRAVSCLRPEDGGYGDPAPMTALGTFQAIRAGLAHRRGSDNLAGVVVAVQGVGNVGRNLCRLLHDAGARLVVSDTHHALNLDWAAKICDAKVIEPEAIYAVACDVFAPCAIGGTINARTIPQLKAEIVAGAANNQLADAADAQRLAERNILYLPDYVVNGGGLISCAAEWYRSDPALIERDVLSIRATCERIVTEAAASGVTTAEAADGIAKRLVAEAGL